MKILNNLLKFSINQLLIIEENIIQKILALWKSNNVFPSLIYVQDYFPAEENEKEIYEYDESILWAVPKSRRTVEKRRSRRIGAFNYVCKLYPVKKLITCSSCGGPHEVGRLCPTCYKNVNQITQKIKDAMLAKQGLDPVEHEYLPVFKDDNFDEKQHFYEGKRIVEIPENRPLWFSKKLTQKSNVTTSEDGSLIHPNPLHIKKH